MTTNIGRALLGLVVIIIIGAGAYFLSKPNGAMAPATEQAITNAPAGQKSMGALVAAGTPVTCTFSTTTAAGTTKGTLFVSNGMVAGNFTTTGTAAGSIDSHMLVRDNTSYVWSSFSSTGFKSTITATSSTPGNSKGVDYNAQVDYQCQPWVADSSKFTLPTDISFMSTASYTAPPQGAGATGAAPAGMPKGTAAQCGACANLPSAQKAQCLAALQC